MTQSFKMSFWPNFLVLLVFIFASTSARMSSTEYKFLDVYKNCPSGDKREKHQTSIISYSVYLGNQSRPLDCHYEFEMMTKNLRDRYGFHVYFEELELRNEDHIQFGRDSFVVTSYESQKYSRNQTSKSYHEWKDFEFDLWIKVQGKNYQPKLNLTITIFKKNCREDSGNWRNCPGESYCINKDFFCDGYHNCPHG